jgi:hypothetical protein
VKKLEKSSFTINKTLLTLEIFAQKLNENNVNFS